MTLPSPQVASSHYHRSGYLTDERWMSFYHQFTLVQQTHPERALEIGMGRGTVSRELRAENITVVTLDIDPALAPDVVGSVTALPFPDASFDTLLCAEVLEHIPWEQFPGALRELHRVTGRFVVLSLPHWGITWSLFFKAPLLRPRFFFFKMPWWRQHRWNGEHYWEIGKRGYPARRIARHILDAGFSILEDRVFPDDPAHHFYLLEKRM